ncbi:hypothetical protein OEZ85_009893 [Tetradesmus obliquus]|uniref:Uncharacterized protein n=1 Tax=Tetradesmus obliquus TaxID=3088 RepID=A0ABY8UAF2_TETOB|nr:hypothetical protein OEZ85_009893 [Tetradesmus obliquus]
MTYQINLVVDFERKWYGRCSLAGESSAPTSTVLRSSPCKGTSTKIANQEQSAQTVHYTQDVACQTSLFLDSAESPACKQPHRGSYLSRCSSSSSSNSAPPSPVAARLSIAEPGTPRLSTDGPFAAGSEAGSARSSDSASATGDDAPSTGKPAAALLLQPALLAAVYALGRMDRRRSSTAVGLPLLKIRTAAASSDSTAEPAAPSTPTAPGTPAAAPPAKAAPPPPPPPPKGAAGWANTPGLTRLPAVQASRDRIMRTRRPSAGLGTAAGKTAGISSISSSSGDGSSLLAELSGKSSHVQAMQHDLATRCADIDSWAEAIRSFDSKDMGECSRLVGSIDGQLDSLSDSAGVLRLYGREQWPGTKWEAMLEAVAEQRRMLQAAEEAKRFKPAAAGGSLNSTAGSCEAGLAKLLAVEERWMQPQHGPRISKACSDNGVPFKAEVPLAELKKASMGFAVVMSKASMREAHRLGLQQQPTAAAAGGKAQRWRAQAPSCQQRQQQLLGDAVLFVHKVHGFARGLSTPAAAAFRQLDAMLLQVEGGSFVADAGAAAAAL